jgi:hypothetical protein
MPSDDRSTPGPADPGYANVRKYLLYGLSLPERAIRSASGVVAGTLRESASLLVPQAFQNSRTYSLLVRQMLDFLAEDVGGVARPETAGGPPKIEYFVARKTVGNFIDLASLATLHLSPLLVLAIAADVAYGSGVYLKELATELKQQGVIAPDSTIDHVDDLLESVAAASGATAAALGAPPLSLEGLKQTVYETRASLQAIEPARMIPQAELARLWEEIHQTARSQGVNPLAISGAMTLFCLGKIGTLGRGALSGVKAACVLVDRHVLEHYAAALADIRRRGLYASLAATSQPYLEAVWNNFSHRQPTFTERLLSGQLTAQAWTALRRRFGGK